MTNEQKISLKGVISTDLTDQRLDFALSQLFPRYSRSQLQNWIKSGNVQVDQQICRKNRQKVIPGQEISIEATLTAKENWLGQEIDLTISFEDEYLIVVNKPAGLVTHPGAGNPDQTLVNALLHYHPPLSNLPRAGIIHRLDKETSGLLVVAKTLETYNELTKMMKAREIKREYLALVKGTPLSGKTINEPIGRHPSARTKMAVTPSGRHAVTHFRIREKFNAFALLDVELETGRTHQIRVHLLHVHHPIVGDQTYGKHIQTPHNLSEDVSSHFKKFHRQALHAAKLSFTHPVTHHPIQVEAPLPDDMKELLNALRKET